MADRVSASITIGGRVAPDAFSELTLHIQQEGLCVEWDGEAFQPSDRAIGRPLRLCAHDVPWGRFEELEAFCVRKGLPFARWSGGYPGQWAAHRVVFTGTGNPETYLADEEDVTLIGADVVRRLGAFEAVLAYFDKADAPIPPLIVVGDAAIAD
ncbi:MAG: hypothetical protein ACTHLA_13200 [Asticcacaulis sp.]|uniref:hypothetical protein n=1 Tax=Asticcacaulis sp. TaxID=1872648 RepID=UPI003F7B6818